MANPTALRPSISRMLRLPANSASVSVTCPRVPTAAFSTSTAHSKRKTRDSNRLRGVSSMRRTGPREPLSVSWEELPKPRRHLPEVSVDPRHGLWQFFYKKQLLPTPKESQAHGRPWKVEELRGKSWEDLHKLWYVCLKERNRLLTARHERARRMVGFGEYEADERDEVVQKTMRAIKHTLTERYYVWEDARKLAAEDPEINLWAGEREPAYSGYVAPSDRTSKWQPEPEPELEVNAEEQAAAETSAEQKPAAGDGASAEEEVAAVDDASVEGKTEPAAEVGSGATAVTSEKQTQKAETEVDSKEEEKPKKSKKKAQKVEEKTQEAKEAKKAEAKPVDLPVPKL